MKNYLKQLLRNLYNLILRRKNIIIGQNVLYNQKTVFEDHIRINTNTHIYDTHIGRGTYIGENGVINSAYIGRFCSIGSDVRIVTGNHPVHTWVSMHPAFFSVKKQAGFTFVKDEKWKGKKYIDDTGFECMIGNDVWICDRVTILPGLKITDGCVLAAGSVITKDTEPYGIYAGVPAKKIDQRFESDTIVRILKSQWWYWSMEQLRQNADMFETVGEFVKLKDNSR